MGCSFDFMSTMDKRSLENLDQRQVYFSGQKCDCTALSYKTGTVFQLGKPTLQCRRHLAMG